MNIVALCSRATSLSRPATPAGTVNRATAPAEDLTGGRGRSVGRSSTGTPASCSRQYPS